MAPSVIPLPIVCATRSPSDLVSVVLAMLLLGVELTWNFDTLLIAGPLEGEENLLVKVIYT